MWPAGGWPCEGGKASRAVQTAGRATGRGWWLGGGGAPWHPPSDPARPVEIAGGSRRWAGPCLPRGRERRVDCRCPGVPSHRREINSLMAGGSALLWLARLDRFGLPWPLPPRCPVVLAGSGGTHLSRPRRPNWGRRPYEPPALRGPRARGRAVVGKDLLPCADVPIGRRRIAGAPRGAARRETACDRGSV
jgi:hypothetical protein